jgi:thiamine kinase-like enzyme
VRELARFQAKWWNSAELEALDWMPKTNVEWQVAAVEQGYAEGMAPFCEFAAEYLTPELRDIANRFGKSIRPIMNNIADDMPTTMVHGDYRLDNMFFATAQGGVEFAVIDWQIANRGGGVFDVAYFVSGTLTPDERRSREHEIVKLYHDTLVENGVKNYTFDQCWQDYRTATLFLLPYSVIGAGSIDLSNERGIDLFKKITSGTLAAISDLKSGELLD